MRRRNHNKQKQSDYASMDVVQLLAVIAKQQGEIEQQETDLRAQERALKVKDQHIQDSEKRLKEKTCYIHILEEYLRLAKAQKFSASSEKSTHQVDLFDEAELETALEEYAAQLPEKERLTPKKNRRQRGFSDTLKRKRVELLLSAEAKRGANHTFFSKVKEELEYLPAQLNVIEYWQEKAVFKEAEKEQIIAAPRPIHPLGKCIAHPTLLAHLITAKYADGLPFYRQEGILARSGAEISRTNMAHWIIRLDAVFNPLITLMREGQNSGTYLNADETRIQVLKEDGKRAQSDKWMWVTCGGPPNQPSVLFEYDPTRAGAVPERLLGDFNGILQADGYSGYGPICRRNGITRIGCWDHARRKFIEAIKSAGTPKRKGKMTLAEIARSKIGQFYQIEKGIKGLSNEEKYRVRQEQALPRLEEFKEWLEKKVSQVMKGSATRRAMEYTLNQWGSLTGYCQRGDLAISNARAENAIRPFAVGRKAWLFADTAHGARASATCYALIETAKANQLDPYQYILYVLQHIGSADTLEKIEALLPWNVPLESASKNVPGYQ